MVGKKKKEKPQIIMLIIVALLSFVFVYPFWQTIVLSFSDKYYAYEAGFKFWPRTITFDAYKEIFKGNSIVIGYLNTILRVVAGTVLTLVITFPAAYAMSHKEIKGWSVLNFIIIFTMFFSGGIVPTYLNVKALGILNTRWALILPGAARAWYFIIMRNYLTDLSKEMEEAARIDGANVMQIMLQVILPLSKSVMAVVGLWSVVGYWNDWFEAMIYASGENLEVLQTVIRRLIIIADELTASGKNLATMAATTPETVRSATIVVTTVPILLGYPFIQKYLVKGVMVGAVKG